jgi:hypothetical protein
MAVEGVSADAVLFGNPTCVALPDPFLFNFKALRMQTDGAVVLMPAEADIPTLLRWPSFVSLALTIAVLHCPTVLTGIARLSTWFSAGWWYRLIFL